MRYQVLLLALSAGCSEVEEPCILLPDVTVVSQDQTAGNCGNVVVPDYLNDNNDRPPRTFGCEELWEQPGPCTISFAVACSDPAEPFLSTLLLQGGDDGWYGERTISKPDGCFWVYDVTVKPAR